MDHSSTALGCISALIVDDNAFDRRRLLRVAGETGLDFFLREAQDVESFGAALDGDKFDVIFADLNLAASVTGFDLLPIVRQHDVNRNAALIMIATEDQAETALTALRAGFSDYIDKGSLAPAALERATVNAVQKKRLSAQADTATAQTESISAIMTSFANTCQQEMRPMLTRMIRHVRQIRSDMEAAGMGHEAITGVEDTCARIEEFLTDLGSLAREGAFAEDTSFAHGPTLPGQSAHLQSPTHPRKSDHFASTPRPAKPPRSPRLFGRAR